MRTIVKILYFLYEASLPNELIIALKWKENDILGFSGYTQLVEKQVILNEVKEVAVT